MYAPLCGRDVAAAAVVAVATIYTNHLRAHVTEQASERRQRCCSCEQLEAILDVARHCASSCIESGCSVWRHGAALPVFAAHNSSMDRAIIIIIININVDFSNVQSRMLINARAREKLVAATAHVGVRL